MIVVDASAVVAILFGEPTAEALLARLAEDSERVMSVEAYVETGTVLAGRRRSDRLRAIDDLEMFLGEAGIAMFQPKSGRRGWVCGHAYSLAAAWGTAGC